MYNLKPKFKSTLSALIKLIILIGAGYFIYNRLTDDNYLITENVFNNLTNSLIARKGLFLLAISLSIFNWILEIFKWQILVKTQQNISFKTATKQSLSALTASLLTPNRMGDYIAKSLYFDKNQTKKIMVLNFIGHGFQLGATILFGIVGLTYLSSNYTLNLSFNIKVMVFLGILILAVFSFKKGRVRLKKTGKFYKSQPKNLFSKIGVLSVLRYLIFSHQFYLWTYILGLGNSYLSVMMAVFSMYLLASIWPSLSLTDWMVKGSAAIFVFSFLNVPPLLVIQVSLLMWICNFALPAIIGSYYVIQFKSARKMSVQV